MATRTLKSLGKSDRSKAICACFTLRKAARALTNFYSSIGDDEPFTVSQHSLLMIAYLSGPLSISKMAEAAVMDRTTLTRNLKPLNDDKLIRIEQGEDRRERIVRITSKGINRLKRDMHQWETAQLELEKRLGSERFDELITILSEVLKVSRV